MSVILLVRHKKRAWGTVEKPISYLETATLATE